MHHSRKLATLIIITAFLCLNGCRPSAPSTVASTSESNKPAVALPEPLTQAIAQFRAEGPKGWAYKQTTATAKHALVEHFDPSKPELARWTLLSKDNRTPTPEELQEYREKQTRRSGTGSAPNVLQQIDLSSATLLSDKDERLTYNFRLKATDATDKSAAHMSASVVFHRPSATIEQVELFNHEPFSPTLAVKIAAARTTLRYSLPANSTPSLLQSITLHIRGRAMWVKSLDEDMNVTYSEHAPTAVAARNTAPAP